MKSVYSGEENIDKNSELLPLIRRRMPARQRKIFFNNPAFKFINVSQGGRINVIPKKVFSLNGDGIIDDQGMTDDIKAYAICSTRPIPVVVALYSTEKKVFFIKHYPLIRIGIPCIMGKTFPKECLSSYCAPRAGIPGTAV